MLPKRFENLRGHTTIEQFVKEFSGVARQQVKRVMNHEIQDSKDSVA